MSHVLSAAATVSWPQQTFWMLVQIACQLHNRPAPVMAAHCSTLEHMCSMCSMAIGILNGWYWLEEHIYWCIPVLTQLIWYSVSCQSSKIILTLTKFLDVILNLFHPFIISITHFNQLWIGLLPLCWLIVVAIVRGKMGLGTRRGRCCIPVFVVLRSCWGSTGLSCWCSLLFLCDKFSVIFKVFRGPMLVLGTVGARGGFGCLHHSKISQASRSVMIDIGSGMQEFKYMQAVWSVLKTIT